MKRRFYLGLIVLAVLLLALGGLLVRSTGALARSTAGLRPREVRRSRAPGPSLASRAH
jgi:hypothetical protein